MIFHMSDLSALCFKFILPNTILGGGCIPLLLPPPGFGHDSNPYCTSSTVRLTGCVRETS